MVIVNEPDAAFQRVVAGPGTVIRPVEVGAWNRCPYEQTSPLFTIIGWLFIATGTIGFAYHFTDFKTQHPFQYDIVWVELVRLIAIVCGVYLLRGQNWARWLALAWIAYHVILSGFHSFSELAIHSLLCAMFAYFLLRPRAARYFRAARTEAT